MDLRCTIFGSHSRAITPQKGSDGVKGYFPSLVQAAFVASMSIQYLAQLLFALILNDYLGGTTRQKCSQRYKNFISFLSNIIYYESPLSSTDSVVKDAFNRPSTYISMSQ